MCQQARLEYRLVRSQCTLVLWESYYIRSSKRQACDVDDPRIGFDLQRLEYSKLAPTSLGLRPRCC